jgi:neutral ceramidase
MKRILVLIFLAGFCSVSHGATIKAGFAERDITPKIGMERPGGYGKIFHRVFHDACKARAAVFDDGNKAVALVGIDALFIRKPSVDRVRAAIAKQTQIKPEGVLIGASHSHSSGPTGMILPGEFDHASEWVQELAYKQSSVADPAYLKMMEQGIIEAVVEAYEKRQTAQIGFGSGEEGKVQFNRRFRMKNGLTYTHPGPGNPEMMEPAGPIDPEVGVIGVWSADGRELLGCVVNWACHATTSPSGISANYVHYLEKALRGVMGKDIVVCFLNGASGDITQVDNRSPVRQSGGDAAIKVGGSVGAEAAKVLLQMQHRATEAPIDFKVKTLEIARRKPSAKRLAVARELAGRPRTSKDNVTDWIFAKEILLLDALIAAEPVRKVEVQAIQIGPAVFLTTPAEYFCQFGLDQKKASPFTFTWPVSLANMLVGYVPTEEALGPNGGGYETRLTGYSNLVPDSGARMRDAGIALAKFMTPVKPPQPPPFGKFTGPWSYGAVPPEVE